MTDLMTVTHTLNVKVDGFLPLGTYFAFCLFSTFQNPVHSFCAWFFVLSLQLAYLQNGRAVPSTLNRPH